MTKTRWILMNKKADFAGLGRKLGLDPLTVRLMVNRGADTEEAIRAFLSDDLSGLHDPALMKDAERAAGIIADLAREGGSAAIASDFDCDGIFSGFILEESLQRLGIRTRVLTPDRISEGYGLNSRIADDALAFGAGLLLTCDNGISAGAAVSYARSLGLRVIVTDHHEVPRGEEDGEEREILPEADAVVDPKQAGCAYPYKDICGAAVAWKLMRLVWRVLGRDESQLDDLIPFAAIATVADVMELRDENRLLVRRGLQMLPHTANEGMKALISACGLEGRRLTSYHLGFILGPCFNAAGRLETVEAARELLHASSATEALVLAERLRELNETRKSMTERGTAAAEECIRLEGREEDSVLVLYVPQCHESVAGIVAGRIRERHGRPAMILTGEGEICKGSARSIEAYNVFEALLACSERQLRFGGHPMAAGFSLKKDEISAFRAQILSNSRLTDEDFCPIIRIDAAMPPEYVTEKLVREFELLEPFGKGNERPLFARNDLILTEVRVLGQNRNAVRLRFRSENGGAFEGIWFGSAAELEQRITQACGSKAFTALERRQRPIRVSLSYVPVLHEYAGKTSIQFNVQEIVPKTVS